MPTRNLETLLAGWERELLVLLKTGPSHQDFWSYWREREEAVERLAGTGDPTEVEAALKRLLVIAERGGYIRIPLAS